MKSILKRDEEAEVESRPEDTSHSIRRVSFLPDVTLHSFMVPDNNNNEKGVVTSTQVEPRSLVNEEESPMDLTEQVSPKTVPETNVDEMMEFTGPQNVISNEESMELTGTHAIIMSNQENLNKHNSSAMKKKPELSPPDGPAELSISEQIMSQAMEFTQVIPKLNDPHSPLHVDREDTMEFTQIVPNQIQEQKKPNKKRKLNDNDLSSPATPPKQHIGEVPLDIEGIEKMSPIKISYEPPAATNRPLPESKIPKLKAAAKYKDIDLQRDLQIPSQPVDEENSVKEDNNLSLESYLSHVNKDFLINTKNVLSTFNNKIKFKTIEDLSHLRYNQLSTSLNIDVPTLEIKTFIIKELSGRIKQSKDITELEQDLKGTIKKGSMLMKFHENEKDDGETAENHEQLIVIRTMCELQAQKEWFEWRIRQLDGFKEVLTDNLEILNEEYAATMEEMNKVKQLKFKIMELKETLQREIRILKEISPVTHRLGPTLDEKLTIAKIQAQLKKFSVDITKFEEIKSRKLELEKQINSQTEILTNLTQEHERTIKKQKTAITSARTLEANFSLLQGLTGVTLKSFQDNILVIQLTNIGGMKLDIDMDQILANNLSLGLVLSEQSVGNPIFELLFWLINRRLSDHLASNLKSNILSTLFKVVANMKPLYYSLLNLTLLFHIKSNKSHDTLYIEATDIDQFTYTKLTYMIKFLDFVRACEDESTQLTIEAQYNSQVSEERATKLLLDKGGRIFPWLKTTTIISNQD